MSSGEAAGPSGSQPKPEDQVLNELLVNQRSLSARQPEEDPDLALAKMLQAQEQAWLAMAAGGAVENLPGAGAAAAVDDEAGVAAGAGGEGSEELTDEEMARRLQEEEEREFQQRLLALAGIGPAGAAGAGGDDAGAGGEAEYASEDDVDPDDLSYEELTALGEAVGTVSRGLPQAEIDALPVQAYYEVAGTTAGEEEQCPICRMEFGPEDPVKVLPLCRHYYHPDCVGEWLKRNKVCCICNKEVLEGGKAAAGCGGGSGSAAGGVLGERRQQ